MTDILPNTFLSDDEDIEMLSDVENTNKFIAHQEIYADINKTEKITSYSDKI